MSSAAVANAGTYNRHYLSGPSLDTAEERKKAAKKADELIKQGVLIASAYLEHLHVDDGDDEE